MVTLETIDRNNGTATVTGTGPPNTTVTVSSGGNSEPVDVGSDGNFSASIRIDGDSVTATSQDGNRVDSESVPAQKMKGGGGTGGDAVRRSLGLDISKPYIWRAGSVMLRGTGDPDCPVTVKLDGRKVAGSPVKCRDDGTWSITTDIPVGAHKVTISDGNPSGNKATIVTAAISVTAG